MIYLDNAATTKVSDEVLNEMIHYHINEYANASSDHFMGKKVKNIIDQSRLKVSDLINSDKNEIYFNSGSTEGINTAIRGYVEANLDKGQHIITTRVEHKAVLETCNYLETIGVEVTYLDVGPNGLIDLSDLEINLRPETLLVAILWVNNETGIIQKMDEISKIIHKHESKLFVDATQAIGKIAVNVKELNIDMLCLSGHKFHGPKGIGALYIKKDIKIKPLIYGGGQEKGMRSGTTNVPGIVGLAKACEISYSENSNMIKIQDYLEDSLLKKFDCEVIGKKVQRSPYISNIIFKGMDAEVVIGKLKQTIISTGSACTSEIYEPSHVLKNMGIEDDKAFGALRFSTSKYTTLNEINLAIIELEAIERKENLSLS